MNATVAAMLGEANFHSPEEKEQLKGAAPHGAAAPSTEKREIAIAMRLHTLASQAYANRRNDPEGKAISREIKELADELLQLHGGESPGTDLLGLM